MHMSMSEGDEPGLFRSATVFGCICRSSPICAGTEGGGATRQSWAGRALRPRLVAAGLNPGGGPGRKRRGIRDTLFRPQR
jgi:hypothetical protein